ncbi:hypothetical protein PENFLA_c005G02187 [Penicillium flavigenum]|uniref:Uncharacterized protein n=1 Tax=Penicillium flavigenum TaxID=254877 RepID=A0A1V6TP88_9EURO|nr:hypothetical protein PENFLA_c005G02187 [Penicillium flavigenum]
MQPVAPGAEAGAAGAPPAVERHGGDGSWPHLMLAPAAATARSQAQVDLGAGLDTTGLPVLSRLSGSVGSIYRP